jgi:DNA-directed RNA polymerase subunit omega
MREDYLRSAQNIIENPMVLVNLVSRRVRQLKFGAESFIDSLEWLSPEDVALREIIEGKISYEFVNIEL